MQRQLRILCASVFLFFAGCSEMSETTQVATATGGVVGAGLGAIIGSTTGDAGGGVVLGALAGAGAGAAVGQVIDSHEEAVRTQDEAIERQEQVIRSQSNQIEELKRASQDSVAFRSKDITPSSSRLYEKSAMNTKEARASFGSSKPKKMRRVPVLVLKLPPSLQTPNNERVGVAPSSYLPPVPAKPSTPPAAQRPVNVSRNFAPQPPLPKKSYAEKALPRASFSETGKAAVAEKTLTHEPAEIAPVVEMETPVIDEPVRLEAESPATNEQALLTSSTPDSTECVKAGEEVNQAQNASDTADKLFHYRRALRLCPESPAFHLGLGEVYLSLGRSEDAEFEFREALRIDPTFRPAVVQLGSLNQPERY